MLDFSKKQFNTFYFITCLSVFVVICLRAFFIPFSHDESATFFFYIQSNNYLPFKAFAYTNNHVLNSALANICYHLAGSHRFVLRIPNVLAFIVLCFGVFRFFKYLNKTSAKIMLMCFFILTLNFLDFFELCRGYGISVACMILGLSYLHDYFIDKKVKSLLLFSIFWQLALAANLTLLVAVSILLFFIVVFQLKEKLFFNTNNIVLLLVNGLIIIFWVKLSLFYKSRGLLDSGVGEDYWEVSFKSLIFFVFGTQALWIQLLVLTLFASALLYACVQLVKKSINVISIYKPTVFYIVILTALITSFYLQKKLLNVNYPEDRTGLFFYIFFSIGLAFFFDACHKFITTSVASTFLAGSVIYFCVSFDLRSFTHYFYHVLPKEFYECLEKEFKQNEQLFTIGGNPSREMNYAYLNYRGNALLNPMDEPWQMHMNCDYYIALMAEKPFYRFFYDEIAYDARWSRVLLKRKQTIKRTELAEFTRGSANYTGNEEFVEFLRFNDTTLATRNCIEADIDLSFKNVPKPFKSFIVLQVTDENDKNIYYKRVLLNWIGNDLSGKTKRFKLTTGPLPQKFKNVVVYLWNIDKKDYDFTLNYLKILKLDAPGINVVIPKNYYPYVKEIIKQELL
jgi:hypothetical protein